MDSGLRRREPRSARSASRLCGGMRSTSESVAIPLIVAMLPGSDYGAGRAVFNTISPVLQIAPKFVGKLVVPGYTRRIALGYQHLDVFRQVFCRYRALYLRRIQKR